jgi:hypothetical protein
MGCFSYITANSYIKVTGAGDDDNNDDDDDDDTQ